MSDGYDVLEAWCIRLHDASKEKDPTLTHDDLRKLTSVTAGYFPAWISAELYQTYGLHIVDQLPLIARDGLKMDWTGMRCELRANGTRAETIDAVIKEAKQMERFMVQK